MPFEHGEDFDELRSGTIDDPVLPDDQFPKTTSWHFGKPASAIRMTSQGISACDEPIDALDGRGERVLPAVVLDLEEPLPRLCRPDAPLHPTRSARQS